MADVRVPVQRQRAWWVHPATGEVIHVHAHAKTVAENPEKFGLTRSETEEAGGTKGFNFYDYSDTGPRRNLIGLATAKGWVRVRKTGTNETVFEVHGNAGEKVRSAIRALRKHGATAIESGKAVVEDPAHRYHAAFANVGAAHAAGGTGVIPSTGTKRAGQHFPTDAAARAMMRVSLNKRAGIETEPFEEQSKRS